MQPPLFSFGQGAGIGGYGGTPIPLPSGHKFLYVMGLGQAGGCKNHITNNLVPDTFESVIWDWNS
jgi:hypothetical protein